jgi:hypothetical protein
VVLTQDDLSLDEEGTAVARAGRPEAGLFHRHGYCDVLT